MAEQQLTNGEATTLFITVAGDRGAQVTPLQEDSRLVVDRSRGVEVNWAHLDAPEQTTAEAQPPLANRLQLNLFADLTLIALLDRTEINSSGGGYVWIGRVEEVPNSVVQFVIKDQQLAGEIRLPDRQDKESAIPGAVYQIRPTGDGVYTIRQIRMLPTMSGEKDYARPPQEPTSPASSSATSSVALGPQADDGSIIDVMVAYTPAVRQAVGGTAAMALEIDLAVSLTNQAYANSNINQRLRLVHTVEVNYAETTLWTDLNRVTNQNDGALDEIHALRDQFGADIVSLWLKSNESASGIGWLLERLEPDFEAYAFNVVDICCATGGLIFAHELGHNMGAAHDWFVDDEPGAFAYSHGYVEPSCGFKTIMAYGSECSWFHPVTTFSNPDIQLGGAVTGVRPGTNLNCRVGNRSNPPCDADNRLTLNNTARVVANFRQSVNQPPPTATPTLTVPVPSPTDLPQTNTPTNTATSTTASTITPTTTPTTTPSNTPATVAPPTETVPATTTPANTTAPTEPPGATNTPLPTCTPVASTSTPTSPSVPVPTLEITSGPNIGAPGSHFIVVGRHFPPETTITLFINERMLADVPTDGNGTFVVVLITLPTTEPGSYRLSAGPNYNAAVSFTIDPNAPLRQTPVSGQTLPVPDDLQPALQLYLPLVQKGNSSVAAHTTGGSDPCDTQPEPTVTVPATSTPTETPETPTVSIVAPAPEAIVPPSFMLEIVTNWPVQPEGRHFHWLLDDIDQGAVYTVDPIPVNELSPGNHTIVVQLAEADHQLIGVQASVTFTVQEDAPEVTPTLPPPTGGELEDLTISGVATYVEAQQIGDLKTLLSAMPRSMRRNYTFVEQTRSANLASLEHPRVILFGSDARFMLSYGSDPTDPNYEKLDLAELDDSTGEWILRELDFTTDPPTLGSDDTACQVCHGTPARPIWHDYSTWPGIFGSRDDILTSAQADRINRLRGEQGSSDRFHFLEILKQRGGTLFHLPGRYYPYTNTDFTMELGPAAGYGIHKRMQRSPNYAALRDGFMLLECGARIENSTAWQRFGAAMREAGAARIDRYHLVKALGISPEHDFQLGALPEELEPGNRGFYWNQADGHLYDIVAFLVLDDIVGANPELAQKLAALPEHGTFGDGQANLEASRQYKRYAAFEVIREERQDLREAPKLPGQRYWDNIFRFAQGIIDTALPTICNYLVTQ